MAKKDTGGPAFPVVDISEGQTVGMFRGMTLRDYFAAKVLGGMAARDSYDVGQATPADRARLAYIDADAMLAERAR